MPRIPRKRRRRTARLERDTAEHKQKLVMVRAFVAKHGWSELQARTLKGKVRLFTWVHRRRQQYRQGKLADWLVAECESIPGWSWFPNRDRHRRNIANFRAFVRSHGWDKLTWETVVDGVQLAQWAATRRQEYKRRTLDRWVIEALQAIPGWSWDPIRTNHARDLRELRGHIARQGWDRFRLATISRTGIRIGRWASHIRTLRRQGTLPRWLEAALETIPGWTWEPRLGKQAHKVALLRTYVEKHGWSGVTRSLIVRGVQIGRWFANCRVRYAAGGLSDATKTSLQALPGWRW